MTPSEVQAAWSRIDQQLSEVEELSPVVNSAIEELLNVVEALSSDKQSLRDEVQRLRSQLQQKKKGKTTGNWVQERASWDLCLPGFGFQILGVFVRVRPEFGLSGLTGGETMGTEARGTVVLDAEARKKLDACVAAVTAMRYGPEGPPADTTFAEIEQFGHEVGRMMVRAVDQQLTSQHAEQFQKAVACPTCQTVCEPKLSPTEREIQTSDGRVPLAEPACHCSVCHRDSLV